MHPPFAPSSGLCVFVCAINAHVRIGLYEAEKAAPQALLVNVRLYTDPVSYLSNIGEGGILDYAILYETVKAWESRGHVKLIETYLKDMLDVCFGYPAVSAAFVEIGKPDVFEDAGNAGVQVHLTRAEYERVK